MEIACLCGAILLDEGTRVPCKGYLISDIDYTSLLTSALSEFRSFLAADSAEARDAWLTRHFGRQWNRGRSDAEHLEEFVHAQFMGRSRMVYECPACGRFLVDERTDDTVQLVEFRSDRGYTRILATPVFGQPH
jgi:hypothetical protein